MIELDKGVYVMPSEVIVIEDIDSCMNSNKSAITLKNGRKIYIKSLSAKDIFSRLTPPKERDE